jgi:hypothetical protein
MRSYRESPYGSRTPSSTSDPIALRLAWLERRIAAVPDPPCSQEVHTNEVAHQGKLSVVRTMATFRLFGDAPRRAETVTGRLSIVPSATFEIGDPLGTGSSGVHESSGWLLTSSDEIQDGVEIETQLDRLLEVLAPVEDPLWDLVRGGYRANWFCFVASNPAEHAVELSRDVLLRLLRLPGDLWLDVCGD